MDDRLRGISCFAGIGGLDLAIREDVRTVCYIERDKYCQEVLKKRMQEGWLDDAPIWSDIQSFDGRPWDGKVDIIFGGFPCQDLSVAGKHTGIKGARSGLWGEMLRIIGDVRPRIVFLENVSGIFNWFDVEARPTPPKRGMDLERWTVEFEQRQAIAKVSGDLSKEGYSHEWLPLSAYEVGAPHKRERWFCLAYDRHRFKNEGGNSRPRGSFRETTCRKDSEYSSTDFNEQRRNGVHTRQQDSEGGVNRNSYTNGESTESINAKEVWMASDHRGERIQRQRQRQIQELPDFSWCENVRRVEDFFSRPNIPKPLICGVGDGVPKRVDRLKCLCNAVVPQQGKLAWKKLTNEMFEFAEKEGK